MTMADIFLKVVNMSISAGWIVLAVLLLRILLKKAPKWITVLLWGIVGLRLIMPFSLESIFSLIPSSETISPEIMMDKSPEINTGIPIINNTINPVISGSFSPEPMMSANPLQIWIPILSLIWIVGILILLAYTAISYWRVCRKIGTAVLLRDNIYQSETVISPFVLGIISPKIYLPFNMNEQDIEHVIAHEQAHIKRKDHLWKPLGFLLLTVHWFNPVMWLGYVMLCRDIELACDEKVIKEFDNVQKADYSQALLTCSVNRRIIAACPLAFGEVGVKDRVKSVLNYKKPAFWIIAVAIVASVVVAICFLTNPVVLNNNETLLEVLNNERGFINKSGETVYFKNYRPFNLMDAVPEKYTLVDLDQDGKDELVVHVNPNFGAYTIFHIYRNKVYGFDFLERELMSLKTDGSFIQSGGAGLQVFAKLQFKKDKYEIIEQAYKDDVAEVYKINGISSTGELAGKYADEFYDKPDVIWEEYKVVLKLSNASHKKLKIAVALDYDKEFATELTLFDYKTNKKIQSIQLEENEMFSKSMVYAADVNFDGEDDLIVPYQRPAAAAYFSAYVWDKKLKQFIHAKTFETLSNVALDTEKKQILSSRSADKITSYAISTFDKNTKDFNVQKSLYYYPDGDNMVYKEEHLKNGEMQIVGEFTKPIKDDNYYEMDSELYSYFSNHRKWNLDSSKWENYLIPPSESDVYSNDIKNQSIYNSFLEGEGFALDEDGVARSFNEYLLSNYDLEKEYKYTYFDMTGDGVPELCVDATFEMYFFTIKNGKLYHWYTETSVYGALLNNGAFLRTRYGAVPDHINYDYYELDQNAKVKFSIYFSWWDKTTLNGKEYPEFYEIDGQEVSKKEYKEKTEKYLTIGTDEIVWFDSF